MTKYKKHPVYLILILIVLYACSSKDPVLPAYADDFCAKIHRVDSISLSNELAPIRQRMQNETGVFVLEDGGTAMVARAWLTEYAEETIDIQYFIFSTDNVGLIACDYLVRAADRGVKVRIIVDDIMVDASLADVLVLDSHENIDIKIYNPGINLGKNLIQSAFQFTVNFRDANQRMHNKTFIVDKKIVITGGRNIADEYFDYDHEYNFRDRDVLMLGKISHKVNLSFNDFWNHGLSVNVRALSDEEKEMSPDSNRFDRLHQYACNPDNFWTQVRTQIENLPAVFPSLISSGKLVWVDSMDFVSDVPGKNDGTMGLGGGGASTDALIKLVQEAQHTIDIQTPYLITTELGQGLFAAAVKRGVRVRILTNSLASTDNIEAFSAYQLERENLLKTGVEIYEFRPDAAIRKTRMTSALSEKEDFVPIFGLHAKSMVVDSKITVIGTFNMDPRSANLNTECVAIIPSKKIAQRVLHEMNQEILPENAWRTTLSYNPDHEVGQWKRVKTWTRKILPQEIL